MESTTLTYDYFINVIKTVDCSWVPTHYFDILFKREPVKEKHRLRKLKERLSFSVLVSFVHSTTSVTLHILEGYGYHKFLTINKTDTKFYYRVYQKRTLLSKRSHSRFLSIRFTMFHETIPKVVSVDDSWYRRLFPDHGGVLFSPSLF